jgi:hypothetical protein
VEAHRSGLLNVVSVVNALRGQRVLQRALEHVEPLTKAAEPAQRDSEWRAPSTMLVDDDSTAYGYVRPLVWLEWGSEAYQHGGHPSV